MNILHVGKYFFPFQGGLENYVRDLMVALGSIGISSAALVHRHDISLRSKSQDINLDGQSFRLVRTGTWLKLLFTPVSPAFPWHLHRLIKLKNPDILHLHLPNPSAFWALALPSARRLPWVVHWHADVIAVRQGWPMKLAYALYQPFERSVLKRATVIIATSEPYRDSSRPLQPWLAKCRVVPLGMAENRLPTIGADLLSTHEPQADLRVLAVGRLTYYKGFRFLIEAAARMEHLRLDLVGQGDQEAELQQLVHELALGNRVQLHGPVSEAELADLMVSCDCLCLPSIERTEAFGMVLLEAMCCGKATVVSDVPGSGMSWIVDNGVTGLKVEPANAKALAEAFSRLAANRLECITMGRRGREKFKRMFEISKSAEAVAEIYTAVLQAGTSVDGKSSDP